MSMKLHLAAARLPSSTARAAHPENNFYFWNLIFQLFSFDFFIFLARELRKQIRPESETTWNELSLSFVSDFRLIFVLCALRRRAVAMKDARRGRETRKKEEEKNVNIREQQLYEFRCGEDELSC